MSIRAKHGKNGHQHNGHRLNGHAGDVIMPVKDEAPLDSVADGAPESQPVEGRTPAGKFAAGNKCGRGNPHARRLAAHREAPSFTIAPAHDDLGSNAVACSGPDAVPPPARVTVPGLVCAVFIKSASVR